MPKTHTKIASTTLTTSSSSIDFSGISSNYTDLIVVGQVGATTSSTGLRFRLNSNTSSVYSESRIYSSYTGSFPGTPLAASASYTGQNFFYLPINTGIDTDIKYNFMININSYSETNRYKSILWRYGFDLGETSMGAGSFHVSSAVTTVNIFTSNNAFAAGSNVTIYGIKAAS